MSKIKHILIFITFAFLAVALIAFFVSQRRTYHGADEYRETHEARSLSDREIRERIGQMLMVGFRGTRADENSAIVRAIRDVHIGGIVLFDYDVPSRSFPRNIENPSQVKELITTLQQFSNIPLFVAVDAEGGMVNRLKPRYGFIEIPSAAEMGRGSLKRTTEIAGDLAGELRELGFTMNLAPVVDVNINTKSPVIGGLGRSFSENPDTVLAHARAFVAAYRQARIVPVLKHFPGHGSATEDSHKGFVDVTETYRDEELVPYRMLIREGLADAVMTAHIVNRTVDPEYPATLSSKFLNDILRTELGFNGIIISDDIQMRAIADQYGVGEAAVRAIHAGIDLIAASNNLGAYDDNLASTLRDAIFQAVKKGDIPIKRIVESSNRITLLKMRTLQTSASYLLR